MIIVLASVNYTLHFMRRTTARIVRKWFRTHLLQQIVRFKLFYHFSTCSFLPINVRFACAGLTRNVKAGVS